MRPVLSTVGEKITLGMAFDIDLTTDSRFISATFSTGPHWMRGLGPEQWRSDVEQPSRLAPVAPRPSWFKHCRDCPAQWPTPCPTHTVGSVEAGRIQAVT